MAFDGFSRMLETVVMEDEPPKRRRWFQFRLRTLLIVVLVLSLPLSWCAVRMEKARKQREAVEALRRMGCHVSYREEDAIPVVRQAIHWVAMATGPDFVLEPDVIFCEQSKVSDAELKRLREFREPDQVEIIHLNHTQVSDAALESLGGLANLKILWLDSTRVTDSGLKCLGGLTNLEELTLQHTQVTDAGLKHLGSLKDLKCLVVDDTSVTIEGVKKLQEALPDCEIEY